MGKSRPKASLKLEVQYVLLKEKFTFGRVFNTICQSAFHTHFQWRNVVLSATSRLFVCSVSWFPALLWSYQIPCLFNKVSTAALVQTNAQFYILQVLHSRQQKSEAAAVLIGFTGKVVHKKLRPLRRSRSDKLRDAAISQEYEERVGI